MSWFNDDVSYSALIHVADDKIEQSVTVFSTSGGSAEELAQPVVVKD